MVMKLYKMAMKLSWMNQINTFTQGFPQVQQGLGKFQSLLRRDFKVRCLTASLKR
jgi:hypothetical protein